jgi:small-conductance mechanosensitive channel
MKVNRKLPQSPPTIILLLFLCLMHASPLLGAENNRLSETKIAAAETQQAKARIAEKQEEIEKASEVVHEALEEKSRISEEVKLKESEAALILEEAKVLKEEAAASGSDDAKKKAEQVENEAQRIAAEAVASKEKLRIAESKVKYANEKISLDEKEIAKLKKELYEIKLESVGLGVVTKWMNKPLFYIGEAPVTFGGVGSAVLIILFALFLSAVIQRIIIGKLSKTSKVRSGVTYAIGRVIHYVIILLAATLAAQCVGFNLGSLAVVFGFLSVGIGFGLQNITSNFISGLILLFERPISVGDFVTVDNQVGTVRQINMRSSLIETLDNVRIIVPNSKFIEGNVTNWSHGSTRIRIHCPVGVAYGSDVPKVQACLMTVATEHQEVLKTPAPAVRFLGFGNSSLDFELLVWIDEPEHQYLIHSDLNFNIDSAFRASGVTIPFPQRDLHIKSSNVKF